MKTKKVFMITGCLMFINVFYFSSSSLSTAGDIPAKSKITEVTVYPGSARVTRQVSIDLSIGEHSVMLEDIIPQLDENSLTVNGQGAADVKIFGAYIKRDYSKDSEDKRVRELTELIEQLSDQVQMENKNYEILRKEKEYLDSIKLFSGHQVPKDLVTAMPTVDSLVGVRQFLADGYMDIEKKNETTRHTIRELTREQQVAQQKLNELRSFGNKQKRQFVVDLECVRAGKFALKVSYLVYGAHWRSLYDARVQYGKGEVELTAFGMIKQTTGEDWNDVLLTLSTAQPTVSGRMPYVSPWILQPHFPQVVREPMKERRFKKQTYLAEEKPMSQVAGYMADKLSNMPAEMEMDARLEYSQVEQKGVSIVYNIARPATIKSDGTENKYPISSQVLKAKFEYSSYPRLNPLAFLGSRVANSEELHLLAGQVNLFLDGDYIGKSSIDNIGPGEKFNLYLGVDENVKVKREQISRKVDDVLLGGIKSSNRKTSFDYKLTVENYKGKDITVHLFEAIPVSENERIKVKVDHVKLKPSDTDWEDRKGVWRWEFDLKPKAKKEIAYSFSVDHPRDMNIPGL